MLRALSGHPHADAESIITSARTDLGPVSRQAIYDVLQALTTARLVRRFEPSGSVARYELRVGDNHHHLVCRACGAIADVDGADGEIACLDPTNESGYDIDDVEVTFWGHCLACVEARRTNGAGSP